MRSYVIAPIVGVAISVLATSAFAHARLVSATPAANTTVASTRNLSLFFNERSVPAFSGFDVYDAGNRKLPLSKSVSNDGKTLNGSLTRPLARGTYRVDWYVASADGHRVTGTYSFVVR